MTPPYVYACGDGWKTLYEHRVIWERENGPIPEGGIIHHINGDPSDNRIENLMLCESQAEHMRIEHGWELRDDGWWKPCTRCGLLKPTSEFYQRKVGRQAGQYLNHCKPCVAAKTLERKLA